MRSLLFLILLFTCVSLSAQNREGHLIKSIYFGGGRWHIDSYQVMELYHFIDSLPGAMNYSISIHSHTDDIGGAEFNQRLSELRSRSVLKVLLNKGYLREAIEIKDFGMYNPVFDNSTHEGRTKNRRVDIIFWPQVL